MKQAKVLDEREFKRVFAVVADGKHALRNRLALMLSHYAGLRVGEIAALKIAGVIDAGGDVRDRIHLKVAWRAVSPARRCLPASRNSFDQL